MTEFINGVEYLYTIPAEEPISYWILVAIFFIAFAFCGTYGTAYVSYSAVVQNRAKRRMAARQRTSLYHNDSLGDSWDINCD